ncbi:MAG: hypothetical protein IPF57_24790 [Gammaproteobacteria bacterium]|nr:hypothetical protein [Gammaproteobacteria bacterium]
MFIALAAGINAGTLALIANAWGAGNRVEAERYLALALLAATLLGAGVTLLTWFGAGRVAQAVRPGPGKRTRGLGGDYALARAVLPADRALLPRAPPPGLRAAGDARMPMLFALLVNGLALGLAWRARSVAPPFGLQPTCATSRSGWGGQRGGRGGGARAVARRRLALARCVPTNTNRRWLRRRALWHVQYPAAIERGAAARRA